MKYKLAGLVIKIKLISCVLTQQAVYKNMSSRPRVLFVGAFQSPSTSGVTGGVQFECRSLINSSISDSVVWDLLDTTMESIPPPPLMRRWYLATLRIIRFSWIVIVRRPDCCLIYSSSGASIWEKGVMVVWARILAIPAILRPVSGAIVDEYRRSVFTRIWLRLVARSASRVACQGTRWREFYSSIANISQSNTPIVYNPVDVAKYSSIQRNLAGAEQSVLFIGWVEKNKGIWDLLHVAVRFKAELANVRFVICGGGCDLEAFRREVKVRGLESRFDVLGWVGFEEKLKAISRCSIYVMLSHREGLPNALLEAMASGRAVIATSVGSVSDLVVDGQSGLLCEAGSIDDIGGCLVRLTNDFELREKLASGALAEVNKRVSYNAVRTSWENIISDVCGRKLQ